LTSLAKEKRPLLIVCALGLAALCVALVIAVTSGGSQASGAATQPVGVPSQLSGLQKPTPEKIAALPTQIRALIAAPPANPDQIEGIGTSKGATITQVAGRVCIYGAAGGGSCGNTEEAVAGELVSVGICGPGIAAGHAQVVGLMPDGVNSVSVDQGSNGTTDSSLQVSENVYEAELPTVDTTLSAVGKNGAKFQSVLPLAELAKANGTCQS
jgi:hypothetical protein